jgi:hypothetical protein
VRVDHVIVATADLDAAAARVEADHGLRAVGGGRHVGLGTHNRIVPLGGGYVELLAIADLDEAAGSPLGRAVAVRLAQSGEGLMGWAVEVDDLGAVAERLGLEPTTIARGGLSARLAGVAEAMTTPTLPFFISRDVGVADPGAGADAGGIAWVEVAGAAAELDAWLGGAELPVRVVDGPPAVRAVGLGNGDVLR